jgi:hypothetical protein
MPNESYKYKGLFDLANINVSWICRIKKRGHEKQGHILGIFQTWSKEITSPASLRCVSKHVLARRAMHEIRQGCGWRFGLSQVEKFLLRQAAVKSLAAAYSFSSTLLFYYHYFGG